MRPYDGYFKGMEWCKKHRENFEPNSCCESYEPKEKNNEYG